MLNGPMRIRRRISNGLNHVKSTSFKNYMLMSHWEGDESDNGDAVRERETRFLVMVTLVDQDQSKYGMKLF